MSDFFTSVPAKGATIRDWTKETLVIDIDNSLGEKFHFEIEPGAKDNLTTRASDAPGRKDVERATIVNVLIPFPVPLVGPKFEPVPVQVPI